MSRSPRSLFSNKNRWYLLWLRAVRSKLFLAGTTYMPPSETNRLLLSAREAALSLGISQRTLATLTKSQVVPCRRLGRRVLYSVKELQAWIDGGCQKMPDSSGQP